MTEAETRTHRIKPKSIWLGRNPPCRAPGLPLC